ncbi:SEFIR domain-containing protein [Oceanobacillus picturae]|uniref:SEFIR domain-containing protein n=1 Tax=Oceanobacillus picturae TaxID=171693 RepID=UPI0016026668|nr:TIR domain-containing protein [Oceanobacillus picturae]
MEKDLKADKVFISYAWSSQEHEEWVVELAERLENDGVEVVLDKWDSMEGQNLNAFMQRSVNDPSITKVLVICDEVYTTKANGFEGGVGTETVIISDKVYQDVEQTKFVPIVADRNEEGEAYIPTYLKGSKYIDMSSEQNYEDGYEKLLRNLYGKPEYVRPKRGTVPTFLVRDEKEVKLITYRALSRFKHQVEKKPKNIEVYFNEFTVSFMQDFAAYAISNPVGKELQQQVFTNLHQTIELRNLYIEFITYYIKETENVNANLIIDFFEELYPLIYTKDSSTFYDVQFDHLKFLTTELMIYTVCSLYKYKEYSPLKEIVRNQYIVVNDTDREIDGPVGLFNSYKLLIEEARLPTTGQKYISNSGQLIIERANFNGISASELVEADFLLFFLSYHYDKLDSMFGWYSPTTPYFTTHRIRIMSKLKSKRFFDDVKELFSISDVEEMKTLVKDFKDFLKQEARSDGRSMFAHNGIIDPSEVAKF